VLRLACSGSVWEGPLGLLRSAYQCADEIGSALARYTAFQVGNLQRTVARQGACARRQIPIDLPATFLGAGAQYGVRLCG